MRRILAGLRPAAPAPVRLSAPVDLPATAEDVAALQALLARADRTAELATIRADQLQQANGVLLDRARAAEQHTELALAQAEALRARLNTDEHAALARAHRTLLDYEDQLATCRQRHGGNSRGAEQPAPTGVSA
jgi:cell division septum initiation protein DivIVA